MSQESDTTIAATLRAARAQIADPARWTQHEFARDAAGESVPPRDRDAVCWCAVGAVEAVTSIGQVPELNGALNALLALVAPNYEPVVVDSPIFGWNDQPTTTHADVLALFDRAIAAAEQESTG